MKKLLLALLTLTTLSLPGLASAAQPEVLEAVLKSDALRSFANDGHLDVTEMKETAIYRCPGCYTIEVTLGRGDATRKVSFGTRLAGFGGGERKYEVTLKDEKAPSAAGRCIALGRVGGEDRACAQHTTRDSCESKQKWEWCAWRSN